MPSTDPAIRARIAQIAANESWANTPDPAARTAPGRAAFRARFETEVDPDGTMDPAERSRRAEYKRKAHYQRLALKGAQARRKIVELVREVEEAEAQLASENGWDR